MRGESSALDGPLNPIILIDIRGYNLPPSRRRRIVPSRLSAPGLRRGALYEPVPDGWTERADLGAVSQPILGLHGADDQVSPLPAVRARYAAATAAEFVSITGGRHDVLNDVTHRTVAATIVLFLERLRPGAELPGIAIRERIDRGRGSGGDR